MHKGSIIVVKFHSLKSLCSFGNWTRTSINQSSRMALILGCSDGVSIQHINISDIQQLLLEHELPDLCWVCPLKSGQWRVSHWNWGSEMVLKAEAAAAHDKLHRCGVVLVGRCWLTSGTTTTAGATGVSWAWSLQLWHSQVIVFTMAHNGTSCSNSWGTIRNGHPLVLKEAKDCMARHRIWLKMQTQDVTLSKMDLMLWSNIESICRSVVSLHPSPASDAQCLRLFQGCLRLARLAATFTRPHKPVSQHTVSETLCRDPGLWGCIYWKRAWNT